MKRPLFIFLILFLKISVTAQVGDTLLLNEVQINSARISITEDQLLRPVQIIDKNLVNKSYDNDLSSAVKEFSTVDIRQRSFSKVQSDISTRGGTFDQTLVLLNGINLSDPQTGHYNLNIPLTNNDIHGIEVVYGPGSRIFGANAFSGAINFISRVPHKNGLNADISYGNFNSFSVNINGDLVVRNIKQTLSADFSRSDGFIYNTDYRKISIYYENNFNFGIINGKLMAGFLNKEFGSYGFYTPQYIDQYEKINTGFAALKLMGGHDIKWDYKVYYRSHKDQYQLFREDKDFYNNIDGLWINWNTGDTVSWYSGHNNHLTSVTGTGFNIEKTWKHGKTALGTEYRFEHIYSNGLGNELDEPHNKIYTNSDERQNLSFFAEHGYYKKRVLINIGTLAYWNKKYNWNFYYGFDAGYKLTGKLTLKAGINRSMRLPTFTDLYYKGPANEGNPDLIPESGMSFDVGGKYYLSANSFFNINVFHRLGKNIISWVKDYNSNIWKTENLTELNTTGIEFSAGYKDFADDFFINYIYTGYTYIHQDKFSDGLDSKYSLDHLKHKFIFNVEHKVYSIISAFWSVNIFRRNGEFDYFDYDLMSYTGAVRYKTNILLNIKIMAKFNNGSIYVSAYNITNSDYFDIGNVPTPGISFMGGVNYKF